MYEVAPDSVYLRSRELSCTKKECLDFSTKQNILGATRACSENGVDYILTIRA